MKTLTKLGLGAAVLIAGSAAQAAPITLPTGGIAFQFENMEQLDLDTTSGTNIFIDSDKDGVVDAGETVTGENAWGIIELTSLTTASPGTVDQDPPFGLGGNIIGLAGSQAEFDAGLPSITGIFYGLTPTTAPSGFDIASTGGFIDLYWDETGLGFGNTFVDVQTASPEDRTALSTFTGITDGIFLARLMFDTGIDDTAGSIVTLLGTFGGEPPDLTVGLAESYLSVVLAAGGAWAEQLDGNFFNSFTNFGPRDVHFRNVFDDNSDFDPITGPSNPVGSPTPDVFGVESSDPGSAFAVPEPATITLMGLGLVGLGFGAHRRKRA